MEKLFTSPQGREILIKITDEHICFYHNDVIKRQQQWYQEQIDNGNDIPKSEKEVDEFYWILKSEWKEDVRNWHNHMLQKNWFTNEMYDFLLDKSIC